MSGLLLLLLLLLIAANWLALSAALEAREAGCTACCSLAARSCCSVCLPAVTWLGAAGAMFLATQQAAEQAFCFEMVKSNAGAAECPRAHARLMQLLDLGHRMGLLSTGGCILIEFLGSESVV